MKLQVIEKIDEKLEEIKDMINLEDAYYINDLVINSIFDPDLLQLVKEMMDRFDYESEQVDDLLLVVKEIQMLAIQGQKRDKI